MTFHRLGDAKAQSGSLEITHYHLHYILLVQGQSWFSVGADYARVGIPVGEHHWGPLRRLATMVHILICFNQHLRMWLVQHQDWT